MWHKFSDKEPVPGQGIAISVFDESGNLLRIEYDIFDYIYHGEINYYHCKDGHHYDGDMWTPYPPTPPAPTHTVASSGEKQASNEKQPNLLMIIKQGIEKDG